LQQPAGLCVTHSRKTPAGFGGVHGRSARCVGE
jgi:hypothetical protein